MPHRRTVLKTLAATGGLAVAGIGFDTLLGIPPAWCATPRSLPPVTENPFSAESVLNSRLSYHSVGDSDLSDTVLANVLFAAASAPVMGSTRTIYAATFEGVYRYIESEHALALHKAGNQMSEKNIAFEIGVAGDSAADAGAALQYAHLAAIAFWNETRNGPACCTKDSGASNANATWDTDQKVQMVNCYGRLDTVEGIVTETVALSSDNSLPTPSTDGDVGFETALEHLNISTAFDDSPLSLETIGQLLFAAYGCTPHRATNGPAGLTVASAVARYYLTERIYVISEDGVLRYHNRLPSEGTSSRDHRLVAVVNDDRRADLRAALPALPKSAPVYIVFGSYEAGNWSEVEAGFAGAAALLQATTLGLAGCLNGVFSGSDQRAVRNALDLPSDDVPLVVFSVGSTDSEPLSTDSETEDIGGPDTETIGDTNAGSDNDTGRGTDTEPDTVTETDSDNTTDSAADSESTSGSDGDTDVDTDSDADADADSDADADADTDSDSDADTDSDSDADTDSDVDVDSDSETEANAPGTVADGGNAATGDNGSCQCTATGHEPRTGGLLRLLELSLGRFK